MSNQYEQRTKKGKGREKKNLRKKLEGYRQKILKILQDAMIK